MDWGKDLSENAKNQMKWMGNFSPTVRPELMEVKGYVIDSESGEGTREYLDANDLKSIASACIEVADWLEKRSVKND